MTPSKKKSSRSKLPPRHFDDPEEGLSRQTSHPRFVALASEDFYYDGCDDFSPFGSDDGHDVLSDLEDWYRDGGQDQDVMRFLSDLLAGWDFGVPAGMVRATPQATEAWLGEQEMNETFLLSECRARVAAAFGQLKVVGVIEPALLTEGLEAIDCQWRMNDRARVTYPDWPYADLNQQRLQAMRQVLDAVQRGA